MKFNLQLNPLKQQLQQRFQQLRLQPTVLRLLALGLATLLAILAIGGIRAIARVDMTTSPQPASIAPGDLAGLPQPSPQLPMNEWDTSASPSPSPSVSPSRVASPASPSPVAPASPSPSPVVPPAAVGYLPPQETASADPSNYGDRYATDIYGNPVNQDWLIVLHETVGTADSAIQTFQTPHPNEDDQVSYHTIIRRDGTIVYIVPPEKRAYGAGNSVFVSANGVETVHTDPKYPPSVNNFSYHISLETPPDGHNDNLSHGGYTQQQYDSLAWLIARTTVPDDRITTHRAIDQSGSRIDPRSFDPQQFLARLHLYPHRSAVSSQG